MTDYRRTDDSGEVAVDPKVMCILGRNESSKTGLLEGLRRANPLYWSKFDQVLDSPRNRLRHYGRGQKRSGARPAKVVIATFELPDDDVEAVEQASGPGIVARRNLTPSTRYGPGPTVAINESEPPLIKYLAGDGRTRQFADLDQGADAATVNRLARLFETVNAPLPRA